MGEHAPIRMKDLAKQLGVSASTVSLVLSGRGDENRIARETQERVFQAAEAMNYRPRKAPKAPPKSRFFGIFLPADIVQGPVSQVFNGIADYRRETGSEDEFLMVTYDHAGLARKKHLLSRGSPFSAAILVGTQEADVAFLRGFQAEIPIAVLNRDVPGCYCVLIDDYEVGRSAAEHFLRRGHRQLGLIAPCPGERTVPPAARPPWRSCSKAAPRFPPSLSPTTAWSPAPSGPSGTRGGISRRMWRSFPSAIWT